MSTVAKTSVTNFKDAENESVSTNHLLDTLSDVPVEVFLLAVIVLCILIVSVGIVWISCKLCARDGLRRRQAKRSTPAIRSVYQWDSMTERE